jgi:xanthine dehydrogenase accessory factor
MKPADDVLELANGMQAKGEIFALATVVRTVASTAAKAGAKAVIASDGAITGGWIGGGCARAAVMKAAAAALADGQPRLISVQPADALAAQGLQAGQAKDGVEFAKSACPSRGTMDIFIEPFLPRPQLAIYGASPVAVALAELAQRMAFFVTVAAPPEQHRRFREVDRLVEGFTLPGGGDGLDFAVVATQGSGDTAALTAALNSHAHHVAFVGSRRKAEVLVQALASAGISADRLALVRAPAGLDIGAITPDEIAFSIVAELIALRRGQTARKIADTATLQADGSAASVRA